MIGRHITDRVARRRAWAGLSLLAALVASGQSGAMAQAADVPSAVGAGDNHTCALLSPQGRVACWGAGADGQLGDGTSTGSRTPIAVSGLRGATAVGAGQKRACAVLAGGSVSCWGNARGYTPALSPSVTPAAVRGLSGAVAVSPGAGHTCALVATGGVACWGLGESGELGDGRRSDSATPVAVSGIGSAIAISAGAGHSCAVLAGGGVQCWGRGKDGELGNGASADSATPVVVGGISTAVAVSSGTNHACALLSGGGIACWGSGDHGQLGDGTSTGSATPVTVSGIGDAIAVSAGGIHTCAVLSGGAVRCWGYGGDGELGTSTRTSSATPVANSVSGAVRISAGLRHTCAVLADGAVKCWGSGDDGELGDGSGRTSATPVTVTGLALPPPEFGHTTTLQPVSGAVRVRPPGSPRFVRLSTASSLPVGTTIDTTQGRVRLTSAADAEGRTQAGLFYDGVFRTSQEMTQQSGTTVGLTVLTLTGSPPAGCAARGAAAAAAKPKRKKPRSLWGDAKGNFRTAGRYAAATVSGTKWLVEDSCDGTLVRVAEGTVRVEDLVTHKTTLVSAPHSLRVRSSGGSRVQTARSFASAVERLLTRLAGGRTRLSAALGGAMRCSLSLHVAGGRIADVIENRSSIRDDLGGLGAPTAQAKTVRARLMIAVDHSIAADRHYRAWLAGLEDSHAACPLPRTAAFTAAGREDVKATKAKERFVAAFNPLARRAHLRTWRAAQL